MMRLPRYVARIPRKTLRAVYMANWKILPSRSNARFSLAKVENVVKPPQKPTVRNILRPVSAIFPRSERPKINPIRKQPAIFTTKVPKGKAVRMLFCTNRDNRNRETPPMKLPVPINRRILVMLQEGNIREVLRGC